MLFFFLIFTIQLQLQLQLQSVESTLLKGVLDSLDAELIYSKNEDEDSDSSDDDSIIASLHTMPIEIKARVAHLTFYAERHQLEANL